MVMLVTIGPWQYVLDVESKVLEQHFGSLQVDAIWVFLKQKVSRSLLKVALVLDFDSGDQGLQEILLEFGVEVLI